MRQPRVPVVSVDGKPLMPTTPKKARLFLRNGIAKPRRNKLGLFYVQMPRPVGAATQPMALALDPGGKYEGVAVASHRQVELTSQVNLPAGVPNRTETRRNLRRARRFRKCPRRPARFCNRRHNGKYWLAPTQRSKVEARLKAIRELCRIYPIQAIFVEDVRHKPNGKNDRHFSTAEVGKRLTYEELGKLAPVTLVTAKDTTGWRERFGLKKLSGPNRPEVFEAQAVDAVAILMGATGCGSGHPTFHVWTALRFVRRSIHRQNLQKGGVRARYGGTCNGGFFRKGDWVAAEKAGKVYRGWACGLPTETTKLVGVADADGKRIGRFSPRKVRLLARSTGFS
ncbi:MAG: RRXRR domain-containing protein [Bacillota bacterium]